MNLPFSTLLLILVLVLGGCQRSNLYRSDEERARRGFTGGASPTQRVEAMGQLKKRILIFDFWNDTPVRSDRRGGASGADGLGVFAADELRRGLLMTQRVIIPTDMKTEMSTQDFLEGERIKVAQLIREGRRLGLSMIALGRIKKIVFRQKGDSVGLLRQKQSLAAAEVEAKLFDVQSGREVMAASKFGEASNNILVAFEGDEAANQERRQELQESALREAIAGFIPEFMRAVEKMTWQGRVAKMIGTKIYVNAGRASGLVQGDILRVLTQGEDIYDPSSGAYLGHSAGRPKGTLEVVEFLGPDAAIGTVHTGGNIQEGDLVQLY